MEEIQVIDAAEIVCDAEKVCNTFEDMTLDDGILRGIYAYGFERPSAIQQRGILPIKEGKDCICQAQSGTGKTATFAIGSLSRIDVTKRATQVLILAPTRELAIQIQTVTTALGSLCGAACKASIGGTTVAQDIKELSAGPHIVVGTPGRIFDMIQKRRALDPTHITTFILDEADEMLSHGFKEQIYDIFQILPNSIQVVLVSATMPPEVLQVSEKFMRDPTKILVKNEELTLEGIRQYYIETGREEWKYTTLVDIYNALSVAQCVIFVNSRVRATELASRLMADNHTVSTIHGEMPQQERSTVLKEFRASKTRILISTDLLSRGIDVQQVSLVINFDLPQSVENYLHRIGRGGRFGRKGVALNFVSETDVEKLQEIIKHYSTHIPAAPQNLGEIFL